MTGRRLRGAPAAGAGGAKPAGTMRYLVRSPEGQELVVPSLRDLVALYEGGFLEDDDLVRSETSTVWARCGAMPALHGARVRRRDPRKVGLLLIALVVFAVALGLLLAR